MKYTFVREHQGQYRVQTLCRVLEVSRSGYYAWLGHAPNTRAEQVQRLLGHIQRVHTRYRGHSGALTTWKVLRLQGVSCSLPAGASMTRSSRFRSITF